MNEMARYSPKDVKVKKALDFGPVDFPASLLALFAKGWILHYPLKQTPASAS